MSNKIQLSAISSFLNEPPALFIGMLSFEERCKSIFLAMANKPKNSVFFKNSTANSLVEKNVTEISAASDPANVKFEEVSFENPIIFADAFNRIIEGYKNNYAGKLVFIDSTTFTHEQLLILLRILNPIQSFVTVAIGYTGAETYSTNTAPEHVWLSRGVKTVRSILGFPGDLAPSKKLHLLILAGFEHERAESVIEQFEPDRITLMMGDPSKSVSETHYETNKRFFGELKAFAERAILTHAEINPLYFSCVDPFSVRDNILEYVSSLEEYNTVICPMNTKLSTIGVGLAALLNRKIRLAYAPAIEYNEIGYSTASEYATVVYLDEKAQ